MSKNENLEPLYSELLDNDNPAFPRLVDKFIAQLPYYLKEIERAMQTANKAELKSILHNVKGISGNYGYPQLHEECKKAEKLCQQDSAALDISIENISRTAKRIMLANKLGQ
ncbi:hypothetical protein MNBD_GAMMA23-1572 [hydrothermal vent metagenome]|uniref:HPt domain-containing protein n=1 Tax=hydrothermal vent metagenome TaxID=652676 RepID=A0A3B0ZUA4_9ZZZZ